MCLLIREVHEHCVGADAPDDETTARDGLNNLRCDPANNGTRAATCQCGPDIALSGCRVGMWDSHGGDAYGTRAIG